MELGGKNKLYGRSVKNQCPNKLATGSSAFPNLCLDFYTHPLKIHVLHAASVIHYEHSLVKNTEIFPVLQYSFYILKLFPFTSLTLV